MPEILGEGFIQILPDTAQFNTLLQAQVTASLSAVEKQFAGTKFAFPAAQNPFVNLETGATQAAATITQKASPALQSLSTQLKSISAIRTDVNAAVAFNNIGTEAGVAAGVVGKQFTPALKGAGEEVKKAGKSVEGATASVGGFQRQLLAITKLAPLIAAGFSIKVFADFEKAAAEATVVFGESAQEIIGFANTIDASFRLSTVNALKFATEFGNTLNGIGFSTKTAADASELLTKRVADTAAALKQTPAQVANAFNLALEGNTRGLKQLDITLSAVDQQQKALQLGFHGTVAELTDAQRATVNYELILEKTAKFQGQAAATADTLAGRIGQFKTAVTDAGVSIGKSLAPALEGVLAALTPVVNAIGAIPKPLLSFAAAAGTAAVALQFLTSSAVASAFTAVAAAVTEAAVAVELLVGALISGGDAATAFGLAMDVALGPVGLIALAVGGAAAAFSILGKQAESTGEKLHNLGATSVNTPEGFKALTGVDINALKEDIATFEALGIDFKAVVDSFGPVPGQTGFKLELGDLNQLKGLDLKGIAKDLKAVQSTFNDLLDPGKKLGAAGIGAAAGILDDLRAAGLENTDQFRAMQAQFDTTVASLNQVNAAEQRGNDILNKDSIDRQKNTAQIQAQTAAITDLFKVDDQLSRARRELGEATDQQKVDQAKLNALILEGGKQEIADARTKRAEAEDSLTAAIERHTAAQKKLDEINAEDFDRKLAEAANAVTEAQIKLREAIKARDDAEKALNKTSLTGLNLTGLNLNQLRTALANARLTLAINREAQKGKTKQELQDAVTQANIDVFDATNDINDAKKEQNKLITEGKNGTEEHIAAVHELTLATNAQTKAEDERNKRQRELDKILGGNSQFAKDLAAATKTVREDNDHIADKQKIITGLVGDQKVDTSIIAGDQDSITNSLRTQATILGNLSVLNQNPTLRRAVIENFLESNAAQQQLPFGPGLPGGTTPFVPGKLDQKFIDALFNALKNNPAQFQALLKSLGIIVPGFNAEGGVITRPELSWIGEQFKVESIIPWTKPDRVWEVLSQSLPHMPATVRQRIEPAIPGRSLPRAGAGGALSVGMTEEQLHRTIRTAMLEALKEVGSLGADVDITVMPPQGLSEAQVARRVAREMSRYWGTP